jgi:hypothetical protein
MLTEGAAVTTAKRARQHSYFTDALAIFQDRQSRSIVKAVAKLQPIKSNTVIRGVCSEISYSLHQESSCLASEKR